MEIRQLGELSEADFRQLIVGYTSEEVYSICVEEGGQEWGIHFQLTRLDRPFEKRWPFSTGQFGWYGSLLGLGLSFGAFGDGEMFGLAIAGTSEWNRVVNVWELHVAQERRRQGSGRALLSAVEAEASRRGYRAVSCETQNTNVRAIRFYQRLGYSAQAVDLSFYSNEDVERGEVSVFMRKGLAYPHPA
jgi:GNAT superfamily N-acetyltransferase